jgi:hypothetical protein
VEQAAPAALQSYAAETAVCSAKTIRHVRSMAFLR